MTEKNTIDSSFDFYQPNSDFTGQRSIKNMQEIVEFHAGTGIRIWLNELDACFESHWHNALEILQPLENHYDAAANGMRFHLLPGDLLIIPPGILHELTAPDSGKRFIYLFDISLISRLKSFSGIQAMLNQPLYITPECHPQLNRDIRQDLSRIRDEYFNQTEYGELVSFSLLLNIFVRLGYHRLSNSSPFPNTRQNKQKEYVRKLNGLLDFIDGHYMEELDLTEIAAEMGFSKYHFSRLFKQYTDFTFCDYIANRRIRAAQALLAVPDLSITEVALESGFLSISTFNRLFKKQTGCTPSEYRARHSSAHAAQTQKDIMPLKPHS